MMLAGWCSATIAQEEKCADFGSINFFKEKSSNTVSACLDLISKTQFLKVFSNGNNVAMNAVSAGVTPQNLSKILFNYTEEELINILQHRNFDDLSIVHLAATSDQGDKMLLELATWGANVDNLKNKQEGWFLSNDRGVNALHYAITKRAPFNNIFALLALGIDPRTKDRNGNIALNYAISENLDYDTTSLILFYTEEIEENDKGYNALHFAAQKTQDKDVLDVIYALVDEKYYDDKTENGETILHLAAAAATDPELFEITMLYSEDFLCEEDNKGAKAIDYAKRNSDIAKSTPVLKLQNSCD